jgi:hypothetical protein
MEWYSENPFNYDLNDLGQHVTFRLEEVYTDGAFSRS